MMGRYLTSGWTDASTSTLFAGVEFLQPGSYWLIDRAGHFIGDATSFWSPSTCARPTQVESPDRLRDLFFDNLRTHMRSDVPVGVTLSGGVDSTSIICGLGEVLGAGINMEAFTYVTPGDPLGETKRAEIAASSVNARLHKVEIDGSDLLRDLPELVRIQGEPFTSSSMYAQYAVFRRVSEVGIKVVLSGQGADELFGGYTPLYAVHINKLLSSGNMSAAVKLFVNASKYCDAKQILLWCARRLAPGLVREFAWNIQKLWKYPFIESSWRQELVPRDSPLRGSRNGTSPMICELISLMETTCLPMLLRYEDRNSMAFSVESRLPFLTPALAEYSLGLPDSAFVSNNGALKAVFRDAMRGTVADEILDNRRKVPFSTPESDWVRQAAKWVNEKLNSDMLVSMPFLNSRSLRDDIQMMLAGTRSYRSDAWRVLNLIEWSEQFNVTYV